MAFSKFSLFCVALFIASTNPVYGNTPATRSPADFWISFAENLSGTVLNWFLNLDVLPDDIAEEIGYPISIPSSSGSPQIIKVVVPSVPTPVTPAPQPSVDPISQFWKAFLSFYGNNQVTQKPPVTLPPITYRPPVTTPSPCDTTTPKCPSGGCKPEQVRIVVVDDCNEHKKSSESCSEESSEEVDIIYPRGKYYGKRHK